MSHLILREELSSATFEPVTRLRIKIPKASLLVPTTDLTHLQIRRAIIERYGEKANLVYVVLACEHLKESVVGFRAISVVEPTKPVKRDVCAGGKDIRLTNYGIIIWSCSQHL